MSHPRTPHAARTARVVAGAAVAIAALPFAGITAASASTGRGTDAAPARLVFQNTNPAGANALQVYAVAADGALTAGPLVATGGRGSGASLGNQGGVVRVGRYVLAVNAGDDTVSTFVITRTGLVLRDVEPSGGRAPVSVTVHGDEAFVLNAGSDSIAGFRFDDGRLSPLSGSTRPLSGTGVGAAEVRFSTDGSTLVVSEKNTNSLTTFRVGRDGRPGPATVTPSYGAVPFGFDVDARNHVIVSEAAPSALSSYGVTRSGLRLISAGVADSQRAACWVEVTQDSRFAYTTNAGSATVSAFAVARDGSLTLLSAVAATTGAAPTDLAESGDGRFLFVRVGSGDVQSFAIAADGSLTPRGTAHGAPVFGTSGLAAS